MRKILVGYDGSEGSEHALNRAITLIDEFGELILLAVIPSADEKSFVDKEMYDRLKNKAEKLIDSTLIDLGEHDFEIIGLVKDGDPASVIIDTATELRVDLIVLGSKGSSELGSYPLGSVANKVVQYAAKPVMVVR